MGSKDTSSKYRYENYHSVDREFLTTTVYRKLGKGLVKYQDVAAVVSILFDEICKDLSNGGEIKIRNFGRFYRVIISPKRYFNRLIGEFGMSRGSQKFRFSIQKKIHDFILNNLDIAKTFDDVYYED